LLLLLFARPLGKFLLTLVLPFIYSFIILHPKPNSNREEKRNHQRLPRTLPVAATVVVVVDVDSPEPQTVAALLVRSTATINTTYTSYT